MIEVNKNTLASALPALGKLICRMSPMTLFKSIKVESADGKLRLSTCGASEEISFELESDSEDVFCCMVGFDEFRDAVRSGRNKTVSLTYEAGTLLVGDRYLITVKDVEWPDMSPEVEAPNCLLPDGIVNLFSRAAQIVDRNEPRAILRGINLSADGITVTNGKELLNFDCPLDLESSITIPLPLSLMQSKASHAGLLFYWPMENGTGFSIIVGPWCWTGKALLGIYPNWKQVIPESNTLTRSITFPPESAQKLEAFLKNVPDDPPHNAVELSEGSGMTLNVLASGEKTGQLWPSAFSISPHSNRHCAALPGTFGDAVSPESVCAEDQSCDPSFPGLRSKVKNPAGNGYLKAKPSRPGSSFRHFPRFRTLPSFLSDAPAWRADLLNIFH